METTQNFDLNMGSQIIETNSQKKRLTPAESDKFQDKQFDAAQGNAYSRTTPPSSSNDVDSFFNQMFNSYNESFNMAAMPPTPEHQEQYSTDLINSYQEAVQIQPSDAQFDYHHYNPYYNTYQLSQNENDSSYGSTHQSSQGYNTIYSTATTAHYQAAQGYNNYYVPANPVGAATTTATATATTTRSGKGMIMPTKRASNSRATKKNNADLIAQQITGNPFEGIISKAAIIFMNKTKLAIDMWTEAEITQCRRVILFWRRQFINRDGILGKNELECGYQVLNASQYAREGSSQTSRDRLMISCIYWPKRGEHFITSVDCINLIEGLLDVEFTVEEKNRVRRNLEGFKPITINKSDPEKCELFKLIMGFPYPKPRNIEKDIKVFLWTSLPKALRKIAKKFSPSYSSTIIRRK
ncbi:uncharacterized protein BX663DRAFT_469133 [Cokeromyces recurvatus]|uniref:uncharacterized protein n=1 Tax=Cokeromyces recurvatus TaxID=90255 RepID=UPI00221F1BF9|nr:uncharacterized protein BX663DRAFT_469133 [Cokeromyces recurvatus]KAI7905257.1 hypothetical protein BX663DRAFT_469133 [Cokeromyces recurvatus]